jgi:hypothetical protein
VNLFKRIEVIILLVLAAGGALWVLSDSGPADDEDSSTSSGTAPDDEPGANKLHRCTVERDYGNARLDIELRFANRGEKRLVMQPPQVKLVTDAGREVVPFFLPFDPVPEIPAGSTQDVRLRYWLEKADLQGGLKLVIGDDSIEVKSAAAFDLETLKNKEPRTFASSDWGP